MVREEAANITMKPRLKDRVGESFDEQAKRRAPGESPAVKSLRRKQQRNREKGE
jgi:hypothetical protein